MQEIEQYEEENFRRVSMKKKDMKKLERDAQDQFADNLRNIDEFADIQDILDRKATKDQEKNQ
jgi:hypothetical protein